ncbi:hypothetical protein FB451DRAFT_1125779 [Mycena latifolia]|nr:hypothetical protein FB451DRAFT_1125779 [Mycena latifolia]
MATLHHGGNPRAVKSRSDSLDATQYVHVVHPGYTPPRTLLLLVAFPAPSGQYGVPFSIVSDACRILTANKDGTLHDSHNTVVTAPVNGDHLVLPGRYTYHVPGEPRYPVCTSFRAWSPPTAVPSHWTFRGIGAQEVSPNSSLSALSEVVKAADGRCVVTGDTSRLQTCHLVPSTEEEWWIFWGMSGTTDNVEGIHSPPNCLATRADLNGDGMDQGHFVFAPYARTAVCVCLTRAVADFAAEYHLRAVTIPGRIHPLNVYVRFAWGIFRASQNILFEFSQVSGSVTVEVPEELAGKKRGTKRKRNEDGADGSTDDNNSQETSDADQPPRQPPLDLCTLSQRDLEAAERLDADLDRRPLAPYEEAAGIYKGYSKSIRVILEYRQAHPEVSAVRTARVARVGEDDDEQLI